MRIRKLQLAGLAVALAGGASVGEATANDVTISNATTTPVTTSLPDGASPGDVTVASGGSITVDAGEAAVTADSPGQDVTVESGGTLASNDSDNSTGVLLVGPNSGTITNAGAINLLETYTLDDADDDGDVDGAWAQGTNRNGIFLQAGPTFTGDIVNSGNIVIEGNNSAGIRLDALLTGDLTHTGTINITGDNSAAIVINGDVGAGVDGDVIIRGSGDIRGENSRGILVDAPITGALAINGTWNVTGYHAVFAPSDTSNLDADDLLQGGPVVEVRHSVGGGVVIQGVGAEDDLDDDGDGILETDTNGDPDDNLSASLASFGSAPAILIQADPTANLVLGPSGAGWGLHVRGGVSAAGIYEGITTTAIRVVGDAGGSTVTTAAGISLDGPITASAVEANAYALFIGENAIVPLVMNRRLTIAGVGSDAATNTAYVYYFDVDADVAAVENAGTLRAQHFGEDGNATAIYDLSDTLATITNYGTIQAQVIATDDDPLDNIPPPPVTGSAVAIDVSASTIDVTLNQIADVPFTDDDAVDNDSGARPNILIAGDILFGSGGDTVNLEAGDIIGDISFGAGTDAMFIDNGAVFTGRIDDSDGALTLDVQNGQLNLQGGTLNLTSATFGADGQLSVLLSSVPASTTFIHATGAVSFDPGAVIIPVLAEGLPASGTNIFLTADGGLVGAANVTGVISGAGTPYLYNLSIDVVAGDPNSLESNYIMKTAVELGLTANQTTAFAPIIDALRLDPEAAAAMASLDTAFDFFDAYEDLMPNYSSAATELAATAIQQGQAASSNRLASVRLHGLDEVSVWAQEIGYGLNREPPSANGVSFRGHGFGLAVGIDGPLDNGGLFGLSASFITSEADEPGRPQGEVSTWFAQGNAYLGTAMGPFDLDFILGVGAGKMQSRRFVEIGSAFSALAEADWWAFEGHSAARASMPLALSDWFYVTPQAALTYVGISEQGYTEEGGGLAIDYEVDSAFSQRLWADVGVEFSARWRLRGGGFMAPRLYAGYRANVLDDESERTVRFVSGGSAFTLTDEGLGDGGPVLGIGLDATNGYSTFSLSYEGEFGDQIERHSINAAVRFRF